MSERTLSEIADDIRKLLAEIEVYRIDPFKARSAKCSVCGKIVSELLDVEFVNANGLCLGCDHAKGELIEGGVYR